MGMSEKVWKKENSLKLGRTLLLLKKIMNKLELKLHKDKEKKKVDSFIKNLKIRIRYY